MTKDDYAVRANVTILNSPLISRSGMLLSLIVLRLETKVSRFRLPKPYDILRHGPEGSLHHDNDIYPVDTSKLRRTIAQGFSGEYYAFELMALAPVYLSGHQGHSVPQTILFQPRPSTRLRHKSKSTSRTFLRTSVKVCLLLIRSYTVKLASLMRTKQTQLIALKASYSVTTCNSVYFNIRCIAGCHEHFKRSQRHPRLPILTAQSRHRQVLPACHRLLPP